jgi:hypothetical protein
MKRKSQLFAKSCALSRVIVFACSCNYHFFHHETNIKGIFPSSSVKKQPAPEAMSQCLQSLLVLRRHPCVVTRTAISANVKAGSTPKAADYHQISLPVYADWHAFWLWLLSYPV